jgi:Holliday junction resolvasome RuvABC DNA-binding subunit
MKMRLGAHRFQRAVVGKDALIGVRYPEVASLALNDFRLQSCASRPERAARLQWIFHPACTLEAMGTRENGMAFAPHKFMAATINTEIAARLKEIARLLDEQGANQFRVRAYRRAAETLENLKRPVDKLIKTGGLEALQEAPGIGPGLARSVEQFVLTGRLSALDRLRGASDPIAALASVPGIGARLAERLQSELGITTLEELEALAHELGKTHDWVVLYYDSGEGEKQCTVVTANKGPLAGSRVVRGREAESAAFYNSRRNVRAAGGKMRKPRARSGAKELTG